MARLDRQAQKVGPPPEVNSDIRLSDLHHEFLVRVFDPLVPSSLHQLTVRYNIPSRLWQSGFHLILERLRHAWMSNQPAALDLLTDLVYDAYKFYTDLLEDQTLVNFRTAWIEALGDLARYRMAIASHQASDSKPRLTRPDLEDLDGEAESSGASIGAEVAQAWDVEDKETWRTTARDWYSMGITEKPGEGRLHHHLALLSRDIRGQEPRALHHFTKS
jgi:protein SMG6